MTCSYCGENLNSGMLQKRDPLTKKRYKSCPHCSLANGKEHVFHPYPANFGKTPARKSSKNPDGYQSYCIDCRGLKKGEISKVYQSGITCSRLK